MVISALHRKLGRDLRRLWAQALAIALVLASGVATLVLGQGAVASLSDTRAQYYAQNRFADVFAEVTRAPRAILGEIEAIEGVLAAEARIVRLGRPDLPEMAEPGALLVVSLPGEGRPGGGLNLLHLRQGRLPDPLAEHEVAISADFAAAHRLRPGTSFDVVLNGRRHAVTVTGIALSPEFIYALAPGEMMPDPARFGILWMPRAPLEAAFDMKGAFSSVAVRLAPGAAQTRVIAALDRILAPYGGTGATGREDQTSHAFLDAELQQLRAMVQVLPPIFLLVAAMLVHTVLSRLIALEREQIGLLKALGYGRREIAAHYLGFVAVIALIGIALGFAAGAWLGAGLARLYAQFFSFPFLVFSRDPQVYALAGLITLAAALGGAVKAVRSVIALPPAVAMAPPAPPVYRRLSGWGAGPPLRQSSRMVWRHLAHWPGRTAGSCLGVVMAVAILVAAFWSEGSIAAMISATFQRAERQDAQLSFVADAAPAALHAARALPGVLVAEPFRAAPVRISNGPRAKRLAITGRPATAQLSRVLAPDLRPMPMPEDGLILSEALAEALALRPGDLATVDFLDGRRLTRQIRVSGISLGYVGLGAAMEIGALDRAMGDGPRLSGVDLALDPAQMPAFFTAVKATPELGALSLKARTLTRFRATLAQNITVMTSVFATLAGIIAVGVVYNFARIALSEQGRELASLRVLGFTRAEVAGVLFAELAVVVACAQPLGWLIGHGIGRAMAAAFSSDLYRVPFVMGREVYATASLIVCGAAFLSALAIRGRLNRLDLIGVLKTRE
ncbi:putative ABC transport system permease protein [Rhodobacter viridis]|uniref:Putative ABC transport system permease protein n=1 Tax=Rhodobacter viridis TaxID=1054202 RepID=A0A318TNG7_9RHOB|nr:ABC transporter permease [Rhodobacter viridis]PYF06154.1 putative ABC transport system permease protein [Rhodobacter viridis]